MTDILLSRPFRSLCSLLGLFISSNLVAQTPVRLTTDLLEHTERVWSKGHLLSTTIEQASPSDSSIQRALVRSAYPSFSWTIESAQPNTVQTDYHIILCDKRDDAQQLKNAIWDSGWQSSSQSTAVPYAGPRLKPNHIYYWRVQLKTNSETQSPWSEAKPFQTAPQLSDYAVSHYPIELSDQAPASVSQTPKGNPLFDFGTDAFGTLRLTLTSTLARDTALIHLGELLSGGSVSRTPGGTIRYRCIVLSLAEGTHTYRLVIPKDNRNTGPSAIKMPPYIGEVMPFRYCEIERKQSHSVPPIAVREMAHYPFNDFSSTFRCSNDTLNAIWNLCKYTIKATSFTGVYIDGDRERIPYEADALINQLCHYSVDREFSMARHSYSYLLNHPTWPTEWILQAILIGWYDYLYTGDIRALRATYQNLKPHTLLALREQNGFISTTTGLQTPEFLQSIHLNEKLRDIVDWPHTGILGLNKQEGGEIDGFVFSDYNVVTNAYHYECLKHMGIIAQALGQSNDARYYQQEAQDFLKRFNKHFLQPQSGLYQDGDTVTHCSLHGNMFPLAFGMAPENNKQRIVDFLTSRRMACSVYGAQFLLDALFEVYAPEYVLHLITKNNDRSWTNMLRAGTTITLEAWDNKYKPNQDWNHAWGAAPANILPRKLLGIEPIEPGFSLVSIRPQIGALEWAEGTMPTIRGDIQMKVEQTANQYTLKVSIPANMKAQIHLPYTKGIKSLLIDGAPNKARREAQKPFVNAGTIGSGEHTFILTLR